MSDEIQPEDLIRYDILTQEALRGVIKRVLEEVASSGLPGEHHFFITFETGFPGVRLSKRMRERYPEEMTIVIQHTFWNLNVTDAGFEIDLSFDDIRERLKIPFASVKGFFDPSVKFGLQFEVGTVEEFVPGDDHEEGGEVTQLRPKKTGSQSASKLPAKSKPREVVKSEKAKPAATTKKDAKSKTKVAEAASDVKKDEAAGADVVSLDSFRKKK